MTAELSEGTSKGNLPETTRTGSSNNMLAIITPESLPASVVDLQTILDKWNDGLHPDVTFYSYDRLYEDESCYNHCIIAWIIIDGAVSSELYEILGQLEDRKIPTLITQLQAENSSHLQFEDTMAITPADAQPDVILAMLKTLWAQSGIIRSLQAEVRILRLRDVGLSDQIGRIDEELRLAAQLQREFLPSKLPSLGPVGFHILFRPAGYVSGDIYDVVRLDADHLGFFLADAVGHGVPAALMTMYIKRCLITKRIDPDLPNGYEIIGPDKSLAKLNHDMVQQQHSRTARFATACYGIINCRTLELTVARAGHPFPLVLRADGTTDIIDCDGGLLGVFPEETFELKQMQLNPGDRLLLYSDGFEVAFPDMEQRDERGKVVGSQQYVEQLKELADGPIELALEKLASKLDGQSGSLNQRDDLTALVMNISNDAIDQAFSDAA